jgi:septation ring formation regulator EzrA
MDIKAAIIKTFEEKIETQIEYVNSLYEKKDYDINYVSKEEKELEKMEKTLEDIKCGKEKIKKYYYLVENQIRKEEHIKYYCRNFEYALY